MQYLPEFFLVVAIHLLAVMSPGPDFIMIARNSFVYSRKIGIYSALGLGLGICVHVTYSLVGIGFIISKSIVLFSLLKYLGAGYLIYIGYKSLRAKKRSQETFVADTIQPTIGNFQAVKIGFFTNVLNPKATLFFFSLFTQVINPKTPVFMQVVYGIEMCIATFVWFSFVSIILSNGYFKKRFSHIQHYIERTMGAVLVALGIKIAFTHSK